MVVESPSWVTLRPSEAGRPLPAGARQSSASRRSSRGTLRTGAHFRFPATIFDLKLTVCTFVHKSEAESRSHSLAHKITLRRSRRQPSPGPLFVRIAACLPRAASLGWRPQGPWYDERDACLTCRRRRSRTVARLLTRQPLPIPPRSPLYFPLRSWRAPRNSSPICRG